MSTLNDNDLFVYQEVATGETKAVANSNRSNLDPEDLFVVWRPADSKNYRVKASDVGGSTTAPNITDVRLTQDGAPNANRFTDNSFRTTITNAGGDAVTTELKGKVVGALGIKAGSDPIQTNPYTGTGAGTTVALTLTGNTNLDDPNGIEDGDTVTANVSYTPETDTIESITTQSAWNQDQTWSTTLNSGGTWNYSPFGNVFDGDSTTAANATGGSDEGNRTISGFLTYFPNGAGPYKIEVKGTSSITYGVNGGSKVAGASGSWVEVDTVSVGFSTLEVSTNSGGAYIMAIRVNGQELVDSGKTGAPDGDSVIKLPSEKDIELFQVNDAVQTLTASVPEAGFTQATTGTVYSDAWPITAAYDGNQSTAASPAEGTSLKLTIPEPGIPCTQSLTYYQRLSAINSSCFVKINGVSHTPVSGAGTKNLPLPADGFLKTLEWNRADGGNAIDMSNIKCDGIELKDSTGYQGDSVKVIATDVSAKTITVNGGNWDTSNQSQVWSTDSVLSGTGNYGDNGGNNPPKAFDGNLNTVCNTQVRAYTETTFETPIPNVTSIRIYGSNGRGEDDPSVFKINGSSADGTGRNYSTDLAGADGNMWRTITNPPSSLEKIFWGANATGNAAIGIRAIEVNGKILVDKVNDDQVWSNHLTSNSEAADSPGPGGFYLAAPRTAAFDGNTSTTYTGCTGNPAGAPDRTATITFDATGLGINITEKVGLALSSNQAVVVTTSDGTFANPDTPANYPAAADIACTGTLQTITITRNDPNLWGIWIDGVLLVDKGARGLGDSKVSTVSPKQGSGTVSNISGNVVTISPYTDNCFKEGQYLTVNKTINVDPKTDKINSYDESTKVITVDGTTDLNQFEDGDDVFMTDNSGSGTSTKTGYKLTTTDIESVSVVPSEHTMTISGWGSPGNILKCDGNGTSAKGSSQNNTAGLIVFDPPLVNVTKVRVYTRFLNGGSFTFTHEDGTTTTESRASNGLNWYQLYSDSDNPITLKSYSQVLDNGTSDDFYAIEINSTAVCVPGETDPNASTGVTNITNSNSGTTLTFPGDVSTNPDLQYFRANDMIGGQSDWESVMYAADDSGTLSKDGFATPNYPASNALDGDVNTFAYTKYNTQDGKKIIEIRFSELPVHPFPAGSNYDIELYVFNGYDISINGAASGDKFQQNVTGQVNFSQIEGPINKITINRNHANGNCAVSYFKVDGELLIQGSKVISTGYADGNNTMTVDGGNWDTSNQSQVWSNGSSYTGSANSYSTLKGGGFTGKSGDLNTNGITTDDLWGCSAGTAEWNGSVSYTESVAMWCYTNSSATWKFTIDGTEYDVSSQIPSAAGGNPGRLTTFTGLPASGTITKFELVATNDVQGKGFTGWYIDGKLLVDDVNDSKIWSDENIYSNGDVFSDPPGANGVLTATNLFDGSLSTSVGPYNTGVLTITFGETFTGTFSVYWRNWVAGETIKDQNGGTLYTSTGSGLGWKEFSGTDISTLVFASNNSANSSDLFAIKVNGEMLLDPGTDRGLGATKVEYQTTGGTGTIATNGVNASNKTITLSTSGTGDARWIANNKAGTAFKVAELTKPAVSTTAYLRFDASGDVSGYQATPVDGQSMTNKTNPVLTFPDKFKDTDKTPDEEFSDTSAYIQTEVKLINSEGDDTGTSNQFVPQTSTYYGPASGESTTNRREVAEMMGNVQTRSIREATKTLIDAEETVAQTLNRVKQAVDNYADNANSETY